MTSSSPLERIAKMLPHRERERFLLICTRFRDAPEDDEYLQMLEAIGFMTLLWKEVPNQISKILSGASPISPNYKDLETLIHHTVKTSVPSYEDLKTISERLEQHEISLKRTITTGKFNQNKSNKFMLSIGLLSAGLILGYTLKSMFIHL